MDKTSSNTPRINTKLKFVKSELTGAYVSFVSQNPVTGQIRGVRQDEQYPKKICVLDKKLATNVIVNTLYNATLIPMAEKNGYVVIEITPVEFNATMEITYIPKTIYRLEVKFGIKNIIFDPHEGRKKSIHNLSDCRRVLEMRTDIRNLMEVLDDFDSAASDLIKRYEADGFVYREKKG